MAIERQVFGHGFVSSPVVPATHLTSAIGLSTRVLCRFQSPGKVQNSSSVPSESSFFFGNSFEIERRNHYPRRSSSTIFSAGVSAGNSGDAGASFKGPNKEPESQPSISTSADSDGAREDAKNWWKNWQTSASELRQKVAKLGLSAVLAYGLFDGVTYTSFFVLAFLGYETSTGKNPAANIKSLLGIVVAMWAGNNVTRPFRVAGAAALAPLIDRGLRKLKEALNLPNVTFAFMLVVSTFSSLCFTVVGLLILSRLGK